MSRRYTPCRPLRPARGSPGERRDLLRLTGAVLAMLAACSGRSQVLLGSRLGPAIGAALVAADQAREPWRCAAPDGPSVADEAMTVGTHTWRLGARSTSRYMVRPAALPRPPAAVIATVAAGILTLQGSAWTWTPVTDN